MEPVGSVDSSSSSSFSSSALFSSSSSSHTKRELTQPTFGEKSTQPQDSEKADPILPLSSSLSNEKKNKDRTDKGKNVEQDQEEEKEEKNKTFVYQLLLTFPDGSHSMGSPHFSRGDAEKHLSQFKFEQREETMVQLDKAKKRLVGFIVKMTRAWINLTHFHTSTYFVPQRCHDKTKDFGVVNHLMPKTDIPIVQYTYGEYIFVPIDAAREYVCRYGITGNLLKSLPTYPWWVRDNFIPIQYNSELHEHFFASSLEAQDYFSVIQPPSLVRVWTNDVLLHLMNLRPEWNPLTSVSESWTKFNTFPVRAKMVKTRCGLFTPYKNLINVREEESDEEEDDENPSKEAEEDEVEH